MIIFDYGFRTEYKNVYYTVNFLPLLDLFVRHNFVSPLGDYHERRRILSQDHS